MIICSYVLRICTLQVQYNSELQSFIQEEIMIHTYPLYIYLKIPGLVCQSWSAPTLIITYIFFFGIKSDNTKSWTFSFWIILSYKILYVHTYKKVLHRLDERHRLHMSWRPSGSLFHPIMRDSTIIIVGPNYPSPELPHEVHSMMHICLFETPPCFRTRATYVAVEVWYDCDRELYSDREIAGIIEKKGNIIQRLCAAAAICAYVVRYWHT